MRLLFAQIALFFLAFSSNSYADLFILQGDAEWCGPCRVLAKQLDEDQEGKDLILKYRGLIKYDIDRFPKTTENFGIVSVPSYVILSITEENGKLKTKVLSRWLPGEEDSLQSLKKFLKKGLDKPSK